MRLGLIYSRVATTARGLPDLQVPESSLDHICSSTESILTHFQNKYSAILILDQSYKQFQHFLPQYNAYLHKFFLKSKLQILLLVDWSLLTVSHGAGLPSRGSLRVPPTSTGGWSGGGSPLGEVNMPLLADKTISSNHYTWLIAP